MQIFKDRRQLNLFSSANVKCQARMQTFKRAGGGGGGESEENLDLGPKLGGEFSFWQKTA